MKNAGRGRQSTASKSRPIGSRSCSPSPLRMMNGAELPAPHGYPVRLIAPGWSGVANVKWLTRIEVIDRRFQGHFMARDYVTMREEERDGETVWTFTSVAQRSVSCHPSVLITSLTGASQPGGASLVPPAAVWPLAGSGIGFPAAGKETLSEEVLSTGTTMSTREVRQGLSGGQDTLQRQMHHWLLSAPIGFDRVRCELQLRVHD